MGKYLPAPADMWSLGVVTFSLIGGKRPFDDINMDRVKQRVLGEFVAFMFFCIAADCFLCTREGCVRTAAEGNMLVITSVFLADHITVQ